MTKYEWESELKKNIHRLPDDEIKRVLEYYDELFADKIERGYRESEIVGQFGNPVDVADKILSEYEGEYRAEEAAVPPPTFCEPKESERAGEATVVNAQSPAPNPAPNPAPKAANGGVRVGLQGDRLLLFLLANVLTGFTLFFVLGAIWITVISLTVSGVAVAIGGAGASVLTVFEFGRSAGSAIAQLGMGVALCGVGILISVVCIKLTKLLGKLTAKFFGAIGRWICPKKEAAV